MRSPIACIAFLLSLFTVTLRAGSALIVCLAHYLLFVALLPLLLFAAETLTNTDIITMVRGKVPQDVIIQKIADSDQRFQLTPGHLAQLAQFGVPDDVIRAMGSKQNGGRFLSMSPTSRPNSGVTIGGQPTEIGVYIENRGLWVELQPEVANFKTGGVLKSVGTLGVIRHDINGHINKQHSPNSAIPLPARVLIYTPDGVAISEYQLLHLRQQSNSREFRTITGGVYHVSGGATRDLMPFDGKKIAPRTYEVILTNLDSGEYGFLPPPSSDATAATGRIGKIYSFRVAAN